MRFYSSKVFFFFFFIHLKTKKKKNILPGKEATYQQQNRCWDVTLMFFISCLLQNVIPLLLEPWEKIQRKKTESEQHIYFLDFHGKSRRKRGSKNQKQFQERMWQQQQLTDFDLFLIPFVSWIFSRVASIIFFYYLHIIYRSSKTFFYKCAVSSISMFTLNERKGLGRESTSVICNVRSDAEEETFI